MMDLISPWPATNPRYWEDFVPTGHFSGLTVRPALDVSDVVFPVLTQYNKAINGSCHVALSTNL